MHSQHNVKIIVRKNKNIEEYTMDKDTANNVKSIVENGFEDALTEIIRSFAKEAIAQAVQMELEDFIDQYKLLGRKRPSFRIGAIAFA